MTGSGTAALESMIAALVPAKGKLLIVQNGVYGERIAQIAAQYQIAHAGEARMDGSARPGRIDAALAEDPAITHVAVIHHETTTGRLNDLPAIDRLCQARGVRLLVDTVSSFGAEAIDFGGNIDAVAPRRTSACTACRARPS
jgi:2-aminoethylphosphonate-pyruvate transaminase